MKRILTTFVLFLVILLSAGTVLLLGNSILDAIRQPSGLKAENASGGGLLLMSEEETSKALETTTQEPRSFEEGASSLKIASEASEAVSAQEEPEEEGRAEAEQEGETGYAYEQLAGEERTLYLELLRAIIGFDENAQLSVWNLETIDRVFACVLADHPELFYVDGYTCTEHKLGEEVRGVTFSAGYTMTKEAAASKQEQIEKAVSRPLSLLTEDMEICSHIRNTSWTRRKTRIFFPYSFTAVPSARAMQRHFNISASGLASPPFWRLVPLPASPMPGRLSHAAENGTMWILHGETLPIAWRKRPLLRTPPRISLTGGSAMITFWWMTIGF